MAANPILIQHSLNAGEVSARFEARQDQNKYQAALRKSLNWLPITVGGLSRRPGLEFQGIAKTFGAIVRRFVFSSEQAYILEVGPFYIRFWKDGVLLGGGLDGIGLDDPDDPAGRVSSLGFGFPLDPLLPFPDGEVGTGDMATLLGLFTASLVQEVVTPYALDELFEVFTHQSADVMYFTHRAHPVHKLSRIDDNPDTFVFTEVHFDSPATIEEEPTGDDLGIGTLTPGATTGTGINFAGENPGFLDGDVGRLVVSGPSRGEITAVVDPSNITVDIIDDFLDTSPIPGDEWRLVLSPRVDLDITNKKQEVGELATLTASAAAFRSFDVGKWITIYGGLVEIIRVIDTTHVRVQIKTRLVDITTNNPDATPAWTLEVEAWTEELGFPSCGCFFQERHYLCKGLTINGSVVNDFENFAKGGSEDDAIARTISDDQVNPILWIKGLNTLQLATGNSAYQVTPTTTSGALTQTSFKVAPVSSRGAARVQPLRIGGLLLYLQFGQRKLRELVFDFVTDKFKSPNLFQLAEHLVDSTYVTDMAFAQEPDSIVYCVRNDGKLLALAYQEDEQVIGWSPLETHGDGFRSVTTIPRFSTGKDWVWVSVDRVTLVRSVTPQALGSMLDDVLPIPDGDVSAADRGVLLGLFDASITFEESDTATYLEAFEPDEDETGREWHDLQTDSALVLEHDADFIVSGLDHIEGNTVRVIGDGMLFEDQQVVDGSIHLDPEIPVSKVEVGLDYESDGLTLRPLVPPEQGGPLIAKHWMELGVFIRRSLGLRLGREGQDGEQLVWRKPYHLMDQHVPLQEGYKCINELGNDPFSRIRFRQPYPFPAEILNIIGWLHTGDEWECDTVDQTEQFFLQAPSGAFGGLSRNCGFACPLGQFAQMVYQGGTTPAGVAIRVTPEATEASFRGLVALYVPAQEVIALVLYEGEPLSGLGTVITSESVTLLVGDVLRLASDTVTATLYRVTVNSDNVISETLGTDTLDITQSCVGVVEVDSVTDDLTPQPSDDEEAMIQNQLADQGVTNDTLVDSELSLPMEANSTYVGSIAAEFVSASSTPDLKVQLTAPALAEGRFYDAAFNFTGEDINTPVAYSLSAASPLAFHFAFTVRNGANAGDLTLQFAQNVTNATATTLNKDAHILMFKKV